MMRSVLPLVLSLAGLVTPTIAASDQQVETEHLVIQFKEGHVTEAGVEMAKSKGEQFYVAIRELLGYEPPTRVLILLRGSAEQPDGSWEYPRVDGYGRIHLFQFTPADESYFNPLAHEMVHVFRLPRRPHHDWFLEEGFAEFVARRVDESIDGFPWYGFPVDVVAGQWIAGGEDIPLALLRENHAEINLPCKAQSYSLRASFFLYLADTYGDDQVLALADEEEAGALADYERLFGRGFGVLEEEWREALMEKYKTIKDVESLARDYRKTPVQYMKVCREEDDF